MSKNLVTYFTAAILSIALLTILIFTEILPVESNPVDSIEKHKISSNPGYDQNTRESSPVTTNNALMVSKDSHTERVLNRGDIANQLIPENNSMKANLHPNAKTLEELINKRTLENRSNELNAVKSPFN